jgi:hypothetical protein
VCLIKHHIFKTCRELEVQLHEFVFSGARVGECSTPDRVTLPLYVEESVSKSHMDIIWKKHLFLDISSTNIDTLVPLFYQCVETRSIEVFWLLSRPLLHLVGHRLRLSNVSQRISRPSYDRFTLETLPIVNREHFLLISFLLCPFSTKKKTHKRTFLFGSIHLDHSRNFDYRNYPLNMRMRVCYLDCHELGLFCYLVIHTEDLLRPLQLFYFQL